MNDFEKTIKEKTDNELLEILKNPQSYQPKFVELAKKEWEEVRGKSCEDICDVENWFNKEENKKNTNEERIIKESRKLSQYFEQFYRISQNYSKQESLVWEDLKKLYLKENFEHGVFEHNKVIEGYFAIAENVGETFFHTVTDGKFQCVVYVLRNFPVELTTDLFILASHFNNLLTFDKVIIDTTDKNVIFCSSVDFLLPLLYSGEMFGQICRHYELSKEIYWACNKFMEGNEPPAMIIADFVARQEKIYEEFSKNN